LIGFWLADKLPVVGWFFIYSSVGEKIFLITRLKKGGESQKGVFMRKTIVTVTLLVMLAVSCENGSVADKAEYTEDGQRLVTVKVNTGRTAGSRSLTNPLAKEKADYMEVIFTKGGKYYRAAGSVFEDLSITIPAGGYNVDEAIMLIGRLSDKTLLATGVLSDPATPVTTESQDIEFTVAILNTDTSAPGSTANKFAIDASAASPSFDGDFTGKIDKGVFKGLPCFQVPTDTSEIKASLTIGGFGSSGSLIKASQVSSPAITFKGTPVISGSDITVIAPAAHDPVGTTGKIDFKFTSKGEGNYIIIFDIPVRGFDDEKTGHLLWHVRGGTKLDSAADSATDEDEGVRLITTAEPAEPNITVTIKTPELDP